MLAFLLIPGRPPHGIGKIYDLVILAAYLMNLATICDEMGQVRNNFLGLKGAPYTIGEYILQKVLDTSPITTTGFCCHKISLAKVGYSRDMCPKQPKKVSHYVKILEKNCLKIKFFK